MTRDTITRLARQYQEYRDANTPTIRGESVYEFAAAVIAAHEAEIRAIPPLPVIDHE